MQVPASGWGSSTRGLGTLIAVMMRYPEVSSVQYDPDDKTLSVSFILRRALEEPTWQGLADHLSDVLTTYRAVTGRPLGTIALSRLSLGSVTGLELTRDVLTVSVEEVGMTIEVLRDLFDTDVLADPHDLLEEEMLLQEETIQESLEAIVQGGSGHLVALRDEGRVVVFNT